MTARLILAHIHLFKNAGTSVEASLRDATGPGWVSYDGPSPGHRLLQVDLESFLDENPQATAVSSHQLRPPLAANAKYRYLPIVFLRHPIDRMRSAYEFERNQGPVSPSARAAAEGSLSEWIDFHNGRGSNQCANFQTLSMSAIRNDVNGAPLMRRPLELHIETATEFLAGIGAVGLVERFGESMAAIQAWLQQELPSFEWKSQFLNTGSSTSTQLEERLARVADELGAERYAQLVAENQADLDLHAAIEARLDA